MYTFTYPSLHTHRFPAFQPFIHPTLPSPSFPAHKQHIPIHTCPQLWSPFTFRHVHTPLQIHIHHSLPHSPTNASGPSFPILPQPSNHRPGVSSSFFPSPSSTPDGFFSRLACGRREWVGGSSPHLQETSGRRICSSLFVFRPLGSSEVLPVVQPTSLLL